MQGAVRQRRPSIPPPGLPLSPNRAGSRVGSLPAGAHGPEAAGAEGTCIQRWTAKIASRADPGCTTATSLESAVSHSSPPPPRVLTEVARERKLFLDQLNFSDLRDACRYLPELHGARYLSLFHARQAFIKLGLTSLPLLNTAVHEVKRLEQEQAAAAREAWAAARKAKEQAAHAHLEAPRAAFQAGSAVEGGKCLHCGRNTAAMDCPFIRCGVCCDDASCKTHRW